MPKRNEDLRHQKAMIVANRLLKELADETADKSAKPTDKIQQIHEDENNFQFDELDELLPLLINEPWFQKLAEEQLGQQLSFRLVLK